LVSAAVTADGLEFHLQYNRPVSFNPNIVDGDFPAPSDIALTGNSRNLAGNTLLSSEPSSLVRFSLTSPPVLSNETFTLGMPTQTFVDNFGNLSETVSNFPVTNNVVPEGTGGAFMLLF